MRGPYAQFSTDEIRLIHAWACLAGRGNLLDNDIPNADLIQEIRSKCEAVIKADPRFRQPMRELTKEEKERARLQARGF